MITQLAFDQMVCFDHYCSPGEGITTREVEARTDKASDSPSMTLEGKVAFVTGGAGDIARAALGNPDDLDADRLAEHYRKRTVLGDNLCPQDIAEAVLHFASAQRSPRSTGNILDVHAGIAAASSR